MADCGNKINILPWRYKRRESWVIVYLSWSCAFLYEGLIYLCIYLGRGRVDGGYLILMKCIPKCFSAFWVLCIPPHPQHPCLGNVIIFWCGEWGQLVYYFYYHCIYTALFQCCRGNKWARHRCNIRKAWWCFFLFFPTRMKKRDYALFGYVVI